MMKLSQIESVFEVLQVLGNGHVGTLEILLFFDALSQFPTNKAMSCALDTLARLLIIIRVSKLVQIWAEQTAASTMICLKRWCEFTEPADGDSPDSGALATGWAG